MLNYYDLHMDLLLIEPISDEVFFKWKINTNFTGTSIYLKALNQHIVLWSNNLFNEKSEEELQFIHFWYSKRFILNHIDIFPDKNISIIWHYKGNETSIRYTIQEMLNSDNIQSKFYDKSLILPEFTVKMDSKFELWTKFKFNQVWKLKHNGIGYLEWMRLNRENQLFLVYPSKPELAEIYPKRIKSWFSSENSENFVKYYNPAIAEMVRMQEWGKNKKYSYLYSDYPLYYTLNSNHKDFFIIKETFYSEPIKPDIDSFLQNHLRYIKELKIWYINIWINGKQMWGESKLVWVGKNLWNLYFHKKINKLSRWHIHLLEKKIENMRYEPHTLQTYLLVIKNKIIKYNYDDTYFNKLSYLFSDEAYSLYKLQIRFINWIIK